MVPKASNGYKKSFWKVGVDVSTHSASSDGSCVFKVFGSDEEQVENSVNRLGDARVYEDQSRICIVDHTSMDEIRDAGPSLARWCLRKANKSKK